MGKNKREGEELGSQLNFHPHLNPLPSRERRQRLPREARGSRSTCITLTSVAVRRRDEN
jgi:hypothetical protein